MPSADVDAPPRKPDAGPKRDPRATPAMRQYFRFKRAHPDCVLFFRMGDFYEMFDEDAVTVHRELGLTLTKRSAGLPMAGVPYHQLENYLRRMVERGFRVAVCEQIQDPKDAKGVVDRAVTRVLTPGTLVDEALLDEGRPNHVVAAEERDGTVQLAIAEVSTGDFDLVAVPIEELADEVARIGPSEMLWSEPRSGERPAFVDRLLEPACRALGCALTPRPDWTFRPADAAELLREHYGVATLEGFGLDDAEPAVAVAGALLRYLRETQAPASGPGAATLGHLRPPRRRANAGFVIVDATSLRSLEIERTMRGGTTEGSLLGAMQRAETPMGKRLLRRWLCFPLRDRAAIEARQRAVAELVADRAGADALGAALEPVQDVARIVARCALGRATPRDLVALGESARAAAPLAELLEGRPAFARERARVAALGEAVGPFARRVVATCVEDPPGHLREGGLVRDGVDAALDEVRTLRRDATSWLADYQRQLVEQSGIASLKVGFNKVFGYYIEITHANRERVPTAFTRKQTLKNAERYITPELKEFEEKVLTAEERAIEREKAIFESLCREAAALAAPLAEYGDLVARLDVLRGFAESAVRHGYVRPEIAEEPVLEIRGGRHPVLDRMLGERFVPNDCVLGADGGARLALITGPNMAGKSTAIRQAALLALLAHVGSFVPAESARIGLLDRIFTRVGASDELHAGHSTFMVEMTETANILHHATERSLVILDEIGRGTSTWDGLALAWAIAETIADRGCRALFATHYHELTELADRRADVGNLHVQVREWGEEIVFLYRVAPGRADQSYGIHVARIAGVPRPTIERASEVLAALVAHAAPPGGEVPAPARSDQLELFAPRRADHPVLPKLRAVALESLTPLAAFDLLRGLVAEARGEAEGAARDDA